MSKDSVRATRSKLSRNHVLQSTITRIYQAGYLKASLNDIAEHAGFSKSAILHHFPSRAALMAEVAIEAWSQNKAAITAAVQHRDAGVTPLEAFAREVWNQFKKPHNLAEIEIAIASRSDGELREALEPTSTMADSEARALYREVRLASGFDNSTRSDQLYALGHAILRDLAIELAVGKDPNVESAAAVWVEMLASGRLD